MDELYKTNVESKKPDTKSIYCISLLISGSKTSKNNQNYYSLVKHIRTVINFQGGSSYWEALSYSTSGAFRMCSFPFYCSTSQPGFGILKWVHFVKIH